MRSLFLRRPVDKRTFPARALSRHDGLEALVKPCLRLRRDSAQGRAARGCERSIPQIVNRFTALRQLRRLDQILSGTIHPLNSFLRAIANSEHCIVEGSHIEDGLSGWSAAVTTFLPLSSTRTALAMPLKTHCAIEARGQRPVEIVAARNSRHRLWFADSTADRRAPERAYLLS
jgi:hypothetical protein